MFRLTRAVLRTLMRGNSGSVSHDDERPWLSSFIAAIMNLDGRMAGCVLCGVFCTKLHFRIA